jgi:hypothetical protein
MGQRCVGPGGREAKRVSVQLDMVADAGADVLPDVPVPVLAGAPGLPGVGLVRDPSPSIWFDPDSWAGDLDVLEVVVDAVCGRAERQGGGAGEGDAVELAGAVVRLRGLVARLDAARLAVLPVVEGDGRWAVDGSRSFAHWLARTEDVALGTARRDVRTARVLRDALPATRAAALDGHVGVDHVRAMVDVAASSPARRDVLAAPVDAPVETSGTTASDTADTADTADTPGSGAGERGAVAVTVTGEQALLSVARTLPLGAFRRAVRYFARVADPGADERGFTSAQEREFFEVSATWGGYHLAGFLTAEHGQALTLALQAVAGAPAAGERRTGSQRRAQCLADLARLALDHGLTGTGAAVRPHLVVHVSHTELTNLARTTGTGAGPDATGTAAGAGPGADPRSDAAAFLTDPATALTGPGPAHWQDDPHLFAPVPASLLRRLACDAQVTRVVFGPDSAILDVGRSQRTITGQLRRAVIARDQHCTYPGCDQPPSRCEVHHALTHWADGGTTSTDNAALLCWHHHDHVDTKGIAMAWTSPPNGTCRWTFTRPDGTVITDTRITNTT